MIFLGVVKEKVMKRAKLLEELLMFRFEEAYEGWQEKRFTQEEAGLCFFAQEWGWFISDSTGFCC